MRFERNALDTATRVAAADDGTNYDSVAISLHWATAALVLFQFVTSFTWDYFQRETRETMEGLHTSTGVLLAIVIVSRVAWRLIPGHQKASLQVGWVRFASKLVHYAMYAALLTQAVLGLTIGWAAGHPIHLFGLPIPGPIEALPRPTRHELREIHQWVGYTIVIIAAGHALAALYHHYGLRDRVLQRMAPWVRPRAAA